MKRMKTKLLYVPVVMAVMSALAIVVSAAPHILIPAATTAAPSARWTTTAPSGGNLNGKMFTLSFNGGGITFYPAYVNPSSTALFPTTPSTTTRSTPTTTSTHTRSTPTTTSTHTRSTPTTTSTHTRSTHTTTTKTTTRPTTTRPTTTRYPPWTSAPPVRGVSICLRFVTDYMQTSNPTLFTLSPSSQNPLKMAVTAGGVYVLTFDRYGYNRLYLQPNKLFWNYIEPEIWTKVCLTVDSMKNIAQVFSGRSISIRKMLPSQYAWSGEPVIYFPGFDGQVTDVQVWDYPISYREIFNYMSSIIYRSDVGSVLTWSSISYSPRGRILLEDIYERQEKQLISSRGRWHQRKRGKKKTRLFSNMGEREERKPQQL